MDDAVGEQEVPLSWCLCAVHGAGSWGHAGVLISQAGADCGEGSASTCVAKEGWGPEQKTQHGPINAVKPFLE